MNNKGFTLIELLVALTLLVVVMMIAIPNMVGILNSSKTATYVEDAKKFVTTAEYKFRGDDTLEKPTVDKCVVVNLGYLDNAEFDNPPYEGKYLKQQSFIIMKKNRSSKSYEYYVQLVQEVSDDTPVYRGIKLTNVDNLYGDDYAKTVSEIKNINSLVKLNSATADGLKVHSNSSSVVGDCSEIKIYTTTEE